MSENKMYVPLADGQDVFAKRKMRRGHGTHLLKDK